MAGITILISMPGSKFTPDGLQIRHPSNAIKKQQIVLNETNFDRLGLKITDYPLTCN